MKGKPSMKKLAYGYGATALLLCASVSATDLSQVAPLSDRQWDAIHSKVNLLDKVAYFPSLLPVIMKHRDALDLTDDQKQAFRTWRKENYPRMVGAMNKIIEQRIALAKGALDPQVGQAELLYAQKEILQLQRELLTIRLLCRELVMKTFSADQWSSLAFVLEDYPEFAGLIE